MQHLQYVFLSVAEQTQTAADIMGAKPEESTSEIPDLNSSHVLGIICAQMVQISQCTRVAYCTLGRQVVQVNRGTQN